MGLAPSSLPLASVVAGYVGGQARGPDVRAWRQGLLLSAGFILGLATVDTAIGVLFGFLGATAVGLVAGSLAVTNLFLAALLVVLGLALLRRIHIVLPVVRPAFVPIELRLQPALACPFDDLQRIVQHGQTLINLPR